jgi:transcriptional regulator with XRE-family HTH domain
MNELNDRSVPFSQVIRQRRTALRLKQAEIAAALRVEPESIAHWERGRRRIELNKIPRLAAVLQLNAKDLCIFALFEWHASFYATLFGTDRPQRPRCLDPTTTTDHAGIRPLPLPAAARSNAE